MPKKTAKSDHSLEQRADNLRKVIDIYEDMLSRSTQLTAKQKRIALAGLASYRKHLDPPITSRTLDHTESDLLSAWNDASMPDAPTFWKRVQQAGLPYKPRDVLREILERGTIRKRVEYDLLADSMEERAQEGSITQAERARLRSMMSDYERKHGD